MLTTLGALVPTKSAGSGGRGIMYVAVVSELEASRSRLALTSLSIS